MPLVFACIAPHGYQALPEYVQDPDNAQTTRSSMSELGRRLEQLNPDTVIVLTPHGIRVEGTMCVSVSFRASGTLKPDVSVDFEVDRELAAELAGESERSGVPVARAIYGGSSGPHCNIPLDWGAVIPLRYLGHTYQPKPKVIVICPSRALTREQMVAFGSAIARTAEASGKRVALIASADHGHAHNAEGPYGYHPASAIFDQIMVEAVRSGELKERLLPIDPKLVEDAKPDSLWQVLILAGALDVKPMQADFLSYEVPTYFGMLCAAYQP